MWFSIPSEAYKLSIFITECLITPQTDKQQSILHQKQIVVTQNQCLNIEVA